MGIGIGLVGLGQFGSVFADLFHAHPDVDRVALCDLEPQRVEAIAARWVDSSKLADEDRFRSLDELLAGDVDAVAIITQPWLHAAQCIRAMEAGKHVYSAVPLISLPDGQEILAWCERLVDCCMRTGQLYMLGETTWYRPETMFCRRKARAGAFGAFVYAEGEYFHDVDGTPSLREVRRRRQTGRARDEWQRARALSRYRCSRRSHVLPHALGVGTALGHADARHQCHRPRASQSQCRSLLRARRLQQRGGALSLA